MKVIGAVQEFEETILKGFNERMKQVVDSRKEQMKKDICAEIDRMADEELAKLIMSLHRWSRVTAGGDVLTIEIHKPGVKGRINEDTNAGTEP